MASAEHDSHDLPPPPPEPRTPLWLPAVGAALFVIVGLWWATRPPAPPPVDAAAAAPSASTSASAQGAAAAPAPR